MKKIIVLFLLLITSLCYGQCLSTTVWNGVMWSNGAPNVTTTAIINAPYNVGFSPSIQCCDLIVNSTLTINNNGFVTFQDDVSGIGNILVRSGGRFIPVNDWSTCNNNNITIERTTSSLKQFDYVYFSSPTTNTIIGNTLANWNPDRTFTFNGQDFIDLETNYQGNFISNIPDGQDDSSPSPWILSDFTNTFNTGVGYPSMIVNGTFPRVETVSFSGCINTGIITVPLITSGNPIALNYNPNIVGNPYSSSIFADTFIIENLPNISGTIYFWTHTNTLSSYSGLEQLNFIIGDYASYNLSGGISTALPSAFGGIVPSGLIPSCQGFVVYSEVPNINLIFKPSYMAPSQANSGVFAPFYRKTNNTYTRYRLNLYDIDIEFGLFKQILVNYNSDTSLLYDKGWDAKLPIYNQPLKFYTINNTEKYEIDARGDFDINDVVKLGYSSVISGMFEISVETVENIDNIYIRDNGVLHSLPYNFATEVGEFNDRFEIVYDSSLSLNDNDSKLFRVVPNPTENICTIFFNDFNIVNSIDVYDVRGRGMDVKIEEYSDRFTINLELLDKGIYLVKVNDYTIKVVKN